MGYPLPGMQLHVVAGRGAPGANVPGTTAAAIAGNPGQAAVVAGAQQYAQYARHQNAQRAYAYPAVIPAGNVAASEACKPGALAAAGGAAGGSAAGVRGVPEGAVASGRPNDSSVLSPTTGPAAATSGGASMDAASSSSAAAAASAAGSGPGAAVFYAMNV